MKIRSLIYAGCAAGMAMLLWHIQPAHVNAAAIPTGKTPADELRFGKSSPQLSFIRIETASETPVPLLAPMQARIAYNDEQTARVSTPIAGRVVRLLTRLGDVVERGQPLLVIDSPEFAQAAADAAKANSDLHLKEAALKRAALLLDGGVIARKDFEAAQADSEQAQAEATRASSRLHNLGADHGGNTREFVLRAPLAGVITEQQVNPGTELRADAAGSLFVISNPRSYWVNVDIPESALGSVRAGQRWRIQVDAYPDRAFEAVAQGVGKVLDPATRRVLVRCELIDTEELLRPEMFAHAMPVDDERALPSVPNEALVAEGINTYLFVEKSPGVFARRAVKLALRERDKSFVASGLRAGERYAASGAILLNAELQGS